MEGIYFTTMCNVKDSSDNTDPGIKNKIEQQLKEFKNEGIKMHFYYAGNNTKIYKYINRMPFFKDEYKIDPDIIRKSTFIYCRKPSTINNGFIDFLRHIRCINPEINILLEIPTYPYDNEIQGIIRIPLKLKDIIARRKLYKYVDIILTYSNDKKIFGIDTINISNGIDTNKIYKTVSKFKYLNDGKIRFIACANFNLWHGYDRAIEGLYQYLKNKNANRNIELEMVGEGIELDTYKKMVQKYHLQNYVKFHGKQSGEKLAEIYSMCDIGLDSMGRHRSGVYYNSSLKGKEYCAYGMVIVSGVATELDNDEKFEYYLRVPADDSPLDIGKILDFYKSKTRDGMNKLEVRKSIMDYAKSVFDIGVVFKPVINYIKKDND